MRRARTGWAAGVAATVFTGVMAAAGTAAASLNGNGVSTTYLGAAARFGYDSNQVPSADPSTYGPPPSDFWTTAQVSASACPSIIVYAVRGSGQDLFHDSVTPYTWVTSDAFYTDSAGDNPTDRDVNPNGNPTSPLTPDNGDLADDHGFGPQLKAVYDGLLSVEPTGSIVGVADYYPAVNPGLTFSGSNYTTSAQGGIAQAVSDLTTLYGRCPDAHFLMLGYSQGADVIRDALAQLTTTMHPDTHTDELVMFGDPGFSAGESTVTTIGDFDRRQTGLVQGSGTVPLSAAWHTQTYCNRRDVVCQGIGDVSNAIFPYHLTYGYNDGYGAAYRTAALFSAGVAPVTPVAPVPTATPENAGVCSPAGSGNTAVSIDIADPAAAGTASVTYTESATSDLGVTTTHSDTLGPGGTATWTASEPPGTHALYEVDWNAGPLNAAGAPPRLFDRNFYPAC